LTRSPDGILYTVLELTSELAAHKFAPLPETPTFITKTSTFLAGKPASEHMLAAEILLSPDQKHIYVSNRNDPSSEGDSIAVFTVVTASTELKLVREIRTGVSHARGLHFSKDGKYLAVVGNKNGRMKVFEVVEGSSDGELKLVASYEGLDNPTAVIWL
jgi:6-phosphogluconolactonase (cycloisomerase 2 family)